MFLEMTLTIQESVGEGGRNRKDDVENVQDLLNDHLPPTAEYLAVDGVCGRLTKDAIKSFQHNVLGFRRPDGRVDPNGKTLRALNDPNTKWRCTKVPKSAPSSTGGAIETAKRLQPEMRKVFERANMEHEWATFWNEIIVKGAEDLKGLPPLLQVAGDGAAIANTYVRLRSPAWNVPSKEIFQVIRRAWGLQRPRAALLLLKRIGEPTSKLGSAIKHIGTAGQAVGFLIFLIEYIEHWRRGDYHMAFVYVYKSGMGKVIPWAGFVDAAQSGLEAFFPVDAKSHTAHQIFRAFDPVGLGGAAVDSVGALAFVAYDRCVTGNWDMARASRLVDRLKTGPTAIFAQGGENIETLIHEFSLMDGQDLDNLLRYTGDQLESWWQSILD